MEDLVKNKVVEDCPLISYEASLALIQGLEESQSRLSLRCRVFAEEGIHINWLVKNING